MSKSYTEQEIEDIAKSLIGKKFGDIHDYTSGNYGKGSFGHILEEDVYKYEINSTSAPDFLEAGVELKVTPYKVNKNKTLSAKERLVLNIINYMEEYKNDFYSSHFWMKNKKIQIIWYCYDKDKFKEEFMITHQKLLCLANEDINIFIQDYNFIINKIKDGKAHELSEADTMYLGACTKGTNASSVRNQPFCEEKAMQRAFSLKQSYMTQIVRKYIGDYSNVEKIMNSDAPFIEYVENVISKYKGLTCTELAKMFNVTTTAKQLNNILISKMFGITGKINNTDEFLKANIVPRSIRIKHNNSIKESLPFPNFKYTDLILEEWETSDLRETLLTTKYMFFTFKEDLDSNDYIFTGIKLWNLPFQYLDTDIKSVWDKTYDVISKGNIVKSINSKGERFTNFPGQSYNPICHVRPHAQNKNDTYKLPTTDNFTGANEYTKHCFWINNSYLEEILLSSY